MKGEQSDDDEVVWSLLIPLVGYPYNRPFPLDGDDPIVAVQLLKPRGTWARDNGDVVKAGAGELEGKCAADFADCGAVGLSPRTRPCRAAASFGYS